LQKYGLSLDLFVRLIHATQTQSGAKTYIQNREVYIIFIHIINI